MKVYVVFDNDQDDGLKVFHIASSRDKADGWVERNGKFFSVSCIPNIEEVEVDKEERVDL